MSAVGLHRLPRRRSGLRRWGRRLTGMVATAVLLGVGLATALMVMPGQRGTGDTFAEAPAAASTPAADTRPAASGRRRQGMTKAQKRQRSAAVGVLRDEGYRPLSVGTYDPEHPLRALIGRGEAGQRAFFFARSRFVGYDAPEDSGRVRMVRSTARTVTLRYQLYPSGGSAQVRYRLERGKLSRDDALPRASTRRPPT